MKRWNLRLRTSLKKKRGGNNDDDEPKDNPNTGSRARCESCSNVSSVPNRNSSQRYRREINVDGKSSDHESFLTSFQSGEFENNMRNGSTQSSESGLSGVRHDSQRMKCQTEDISLSYSIESSLQSKSDISMGTTLPQDSFVIGSTAGLSSVAPSSINSFHRYDRLSIDNNTTCEDNGKSDYRPTRDCGNDPDQYGMHETNRLPRLTITSTHTQGYLEKRANVNQRNRVDKFPKHKPMEAMKNSPHSSTAIETDPSSPRLEQHKQVLDHQISSEFPMISQDETPRFDMAVNSSNEHQSIHDSFLNISETKYVNSLLYDSGSSLGSDGSVMSTSTDFMRRDGRSLQNATVEKEFWTKKLREAVTKYGEESVEVLQQLNNLGSSLLKCKEHIEAMTVFKRMIGIMSQISCDNSLTFARALDKVGLAASMSSSSQKNLEWALLVLKEALHLRLSHLGPHHSDTVDSLNNIAGVFLRMKAWSEAKEAYVDVLTVRAAIFGPNHPSVAVTAQTLGKVCSNLSEFQSSIKYYNLALFIYREEPTSLKDNHPIMKKIIRNIERTKRLMSSLGF